jgi:hypothetical protein
VDKETPSPTAHPRASLPIRHGEIVFENLDKAIDGAWFDNWIMIFF